jgi:hypothetical protein
MLIKGRNSPPFTGNTDIALLTQMMERHGRKRLLIRRMSEETWKTQADIHDMDPGVLAVFGTPKGPLTRTTHSRMPEHFEVWVDEGTCFCFDSEGELILIDSVPEYPGCPDKRALIETRVEES